MIAPLKSIRHARHATRALTERAFVELRQRHYNRQARAVLAAVEADRGPTDPRLLRRCTAYAREVLGSTRYAPWLQAYAAVSGTFREGWIPDNYYGLVVEPSKCGEAARAVLVKSFTQRILQTDALPDLAYVIDGHYYDAQYRPMAGSALPQLLFADDRQVYFKADNSYQGRSVAIMEPHQFAVALPGLPDGVFQAPIHQHPFFDPLSPRSTATLRITTVREPTGEITVRAAYLRVGRASDCIVTSSSHVRVAVNHDSGLLDETGYLNDWRRVQAHPDTGARFGGLVIPHFRAAKELCRRLHESCPHMPCLGWDVCVDRDGAVKLIEWNARYNDIKFSEATVGPCFTGLGWESLWRDARPTVTVPRVPAPLHAGQQPLAR